MTPCKFQTSLTGAGGVMIYSEDRVTVDAVTTDEETKKKIREALSLPEKLGKVFAMAEIDQDGNLVIGDQIPDQGW